MVEENVSFEDNLKELEEIVAKLEKGDVPLFRRRPRSRAVGDRQRRFIVLLGRHDLQTLRTYARNGNRNGFIADRRRNRQPVSDTGSVSRAAKFSDLCALRCRETGGIERNSLRCVRACDNRKRKTVFRILKRLRSERILRTDVTFSKRRYSKRNVFPLYAL